MDWGASNVCRFTIALKLCRCMVSSVALQFTVAPGALRLMVAVRPAEEEVSMRFGSEAAGPARFRSAVESHACCCWCSSDFGNGRACNSDSVVDAERGRRLTGEATNFSAGGSGMVIVRVCRASGEDEESCSGSRVPLTTRAKLPFGDQVCPSSACRPIFTVFHMAQGTSHSFPLTMELKLLRSSADSPTLHVVVEYPAMPLEKLRPAPGQHSQWRGRAQAARGSEQNMA
mmetsp:Transcript_48565/g.123182  ORF Transcript_48565/g.123182 Transcript_48565/m.123182 type:complete len:230 (-) Transcript_48565:7-696(-)